jgi:hypothetical protein
VTPALSGRLRALPAPTITSDGGGAWAEIIIAEVTTEVTTVTASDPDDTALTYAIVGGAD